jgi:pilus assembly protein CpaE
MNQKASAIIKVKSKPIQKELEHMILTDGRFQIGDDKEGADLLIFELSENFEAELSNLEHLLNSNTVGEIFITSEKQTTEMLRHAMRIGAKEFLALPIDQNEIENALEGFAKRRQQAAANEPARKGKIIHMMGAKGGVGTTTVAVNLAMILAELKNAGSVAMVDLNTVFGEIPLFFSVKPTYHWGHITKNINRLDSSFLLRAMVKHASGVHILPSPSYLNGHPPTTPETMTRILSTMRQTFDFIIVDGGQSLEGQAIKSIEMSEKVILITLLNLPCLNNTKNLLKSMKSLKTIDNDRVHLVINRFLKHSDISLKEAEASVNKPIFWNIPNDYKTTMSAINRGIPIYDISARAAITKSMAAFTDTLIDGGKQKPDKKRWQLFGRN